MNRLVSLKAVFTVAAVLGTFGAASTAHARSDVQFSITLQTPGYYVQPAPVYVQPRPVYVQPRPVFVQPYNGYEYANVQPTPVYVQPPYGRGWGRGYGWGHRRHVPDHGSRGDYDRDGTPNRYDRFPDNPRHR